jgi:hypothetical protein
MHGKSCDTPTPLVYGFGRSWGFGARRYPGARAALLETGGPFHLDNSYRPLPIAQRQRFVRFGCVMKDVLLVERAEALTANAAITKLEHRIVVALYWMR